MAKQPIPTSNRRKSTKTEKVVKGNNEFRVSGHIRKPDGTALPDLTVRAYDQDWKHFQPLGEVVTNEAGYYEVNFTREQAGQREKKNPDIQIRVFNRQGVELGASNTVFNAPKKAKIDLVVQIPSEYEAQLAILAERDRANFGVLLRDLNVPSTLMKKMKQAGIESFIDLRSRGMDFSGIPKISPELKEKLTAHARLSIISSDLEINKKLINAGVESTVALAKMDAERLAGQAKIPQTTARDIVEQAKLARTERLATLMDAKLAFDPANQGFKHYIPLDRPLLQLEEFVSPKPDKETCQACEECKSALSPAAYLVDLIDFTIDSITFFQEPATLSTLEQTLHRPFLRLHMNCEAVEQKIRHVEIAIEILENYLQKLGHPREFLYQHFEDAGHPAPKIISVIFNEYLEEMGATQPELEVAMEESNIAPLLRSPAATLPPPDRTKLDQLLQRTGFTETEATVFYKGMFMVYSFITDVMEGLDQLPHLLKKIKTKDIDQNDPTRLEEYQSALARAETATDRIKRFTLTSIRDNLIYDALNVLNRFKSAKELGDNLHIDLSVDACATTTRIADAIEAIQSFVQAFRIGRVNSTLKTSREEFEARWQWLRSYSTWHAAQMVFLYPESFMFPNARRNTTPEFLALMSELEGSATPDAAKKAADAYFKAAPWSIITEHACDFNGNLMLFGCTPQSRDGNKWETEVYYSTFDNYGDWSGWRKVFADEALAYKGKLEGVVALDGQLILLISSIERGNSSNKYNISAYSWTGGKEKPTHEYKLDNVEDMVNFKLENVLTFPSSVRDPVVSIVAHPPISATIAALAFVQLDKGNGNSHIYVLTRWDSGLYFLTSIEDPRTLSSVRKQYEIASNSRIHGLGFIDNSLYFYLETETHSGIQIRLIELEKSGVYFMLRNEINSSYGTIEGIKSAIIIDNTIVLFDIEGRKLRCIQYVPQKASWDLSFAAMPQNDIRDIVAIEKRLYIIGALDMIELQEEVSQPNLTYRYLTTRKIVASKQISTGKLVERPIPLYDTASFLNYIKEQKHRLNNPFNPNENLTPNDPVWLYFEEYYFHVPIVIADFLSRNRFYEEAETWLRLVFNPFLPGDDRFVYQFLNKSGHPGYNLRNTLAWLRDPFNPFAIAHSRQGAFFRHVVYRYVEQILEWADLEYTLDTTESINRARELYELAEDLLQTNEIPFEDACRIAWRELLSYVYTTYNEKEINLLRLLIDPLQQMNGRVRKSDIAAITKILHQNDPFTLRLNNLKQVVDQIKARKVFSKSLAELRQEQEECQIRELVLEDSFNSGYPHINFASFYASGFALSPEVTISNSTVQKIGCGFCIPPNPILNTLRWRIESNLEKIRTCRNYGGMRRSLQTYATPANPVSAVQRSAAGEEIDDAIPTEPPPVYRFSYLIERARYYVSVAQQLENFLLASVEKNEQEQYNLLKAKQDLKVSQMNLALQALRIKEASDGVELARRQKDRAQFQKGHFDGLIAARLSNYEQEALSDTLIAMRWSIASGIIGGAGAIAAMIAGGITGSAAGGPLSAALGTTLGGIVGALSNLGGAAQAAGAMASASSSHASFRSMQASFERRKQDWIYQQGLAGWDIKIGEQGIIIANDRLDITNKERDVAQLQADFASEVVNFLGEKFTNKDLYDWMARVLKRYYREHLNFATVIARMAQTALKFERQESIAIIAPYYSEREKKDLLAAENLLTDINKLDQHRLVTEKRRKELTKVISLASIAPVEFQQLRQEGWMTFAIPMEWFDRDFPGHYMRLIKNVSLTAVALIPPVEGIHATLSNSGLSRVMVPPFDQPRVIQRLPESIAVSAANNGTGLFELRLDDPILLPFEGSGVETTWTLEMPKGSNRFDYETLMDILFTVRYTAMEDLSYRDKVVKQLAKTVTGSSSFGLRTTFPDEWYDLHNPDFADQKEYGYDPGKIHPPYEMEFEIRKSDFPPNESVIEMLRLNLVLAQEQTLRKSSVKAPIEIEFIPDEPIGAMDLYAVQIEFDWDIANDKGGPISLTAFSHKNGQTSPIPILFSTLKPFGRWRLKIKTNGQDSAGRTIDSANYPELFKNSSSISIGNPNQTKLDLNWLKDILFVITYNANVEYKFAD